MLIVRGLILVCLAMVIGPATAPGAERVSFNRQIRPLLADRCYTCHGPDSTTREADLRLDRESIAKSELAASGNRP